MRKFVPATAYLRNPHVPDGAALPAAKKFRPHTCFIPVDDIKLIYLDADDTTGIYWMVKLGEPTIYGGKDQRFMISHAVFTELTGADPRVLVKAGARGEPEWAIVARDLEHVEGATWQVVEQKVSNSAYQP